MLLKVGEMPLVLDIKPAKANKEYLSYVRTHQLLQGSINGFYHLHTAHAKQKCFHCCECEEQIVTGAEL